MPTSSSLRAVPLLLLLLLAAACGHAAAPSRPAAVLGGVAIPHTTVRQYTTYALHYYSTALGGASACQSGCPALTQQVLRRLLEEQAVRQYAAAHHIQPSPSDLAAITSRLHALRAPGTVTAGLLRRHAVSVDFLRSLLTTEAIVRAVEMRVTSGTRAQRYAFHLRTIDIPKALHGRGLKAYRKALDLATNGGNPPHKAHVRVVWRVPSRLAPNIRRLAAAASLGDYIGPFRSGDGYVVIQVIARGPHRVSASRAAKLAATRFRTWVDQQVRRLRPTCYGTDGKPAPCPPA